MSKVKATDPRFLVLPSTGVLRTQMEDESSRSDALFYLFSISLLCQEPDANPEQQSCIEKNFSSHLHASCLMIGVTCPSLRKRIKGGTTQTCPCATNMRNTCLDLRFFRSELFRALSKTESQESTEVGKLLPLLGKIISTFLRKSTLPGWIDQGWGNGICGKLGTRGRAHRQDK
jgi:hypothetical protein